MMLRPGRYRQHSAPRAARQLHATAPQPWLIPVGLACAGLFVGTRYILRAQERVRRQRAGLPLEDELYMQSAPAQTRHFDQLLGLDVGTSNLRLSVAPVSSDRPSFVRIIESADGGREIPAAFAIDNGTVSVGAVARALLGRKPGHTATAARLLLGRRPREDADVDALVEELPYRVESEDDKFTLELDGKTYSPEWAAEILLEHLHGVAAGSLGEDVQEELPAVLAVPPGLRDTQYALYESVAVSAGFHVVSSVSEPVAAVHAAEMWALEETGSSKPLSSGGVIAVFDMGGFTSTVSLVQRKKMSYTLLGSLTSSQISGRHIDDKLFKLAVGKFQDEFGIDLSIDYMASYRILEAVETAKKELSSRRSTDINLPFITADHTGAKHLVQKLSTFDVDRAYEQPAKDALTLCNRVLEEAKLKKSDVKVLLVVGGGARAEFLRKELEMFFALAAFQTKDFRPEEAVVVGAAEFGRRLVQREDE